MELNTNDYVENQDGTTVIKILDNNEMIVVKHANPITLGFKTTYELSDFEKFTKVTEQSKLDDYNQLFNNLK